MAETKWLDEIAKRADGQLKDGRTSAFEGRIVATNGHIMVSMDGDTSGLPDLGSWWPLARGVDGFRKVLNMPSDCGILALSELKKWAAPTNAGAPCSLCEGTQKVECDECIRGTVSCPCPACDGHDCADCDATGIASCPVCGPDSERLGMFADAVFNLNLLWKALPHLEGDAVLWGLADNKSALSLETEHWKIIVMPMRTHNMTTVDIEKMPRFTPETSSVAARGEAQ